MKKLYEESVMLLMGDKNITDMKEFTRLHLLLEDGYSPVTRKLHEQLFTSVLDKKHIDFDDIPKSHGILSNYSGYESMINTISVILKLAKESPDGRKVQEYANIVNDAISNIIQLAPQYSKGFANKSEYVCMEYNSYVYLCVEATTSLIYSFVEYVTSPDTKVFSAKIVNTKLRADSFFFDQLSKFNTLVKNKFDDYKKTLEMYCNNGKQNFIGGTAALGATILLGMALSIVPITREVVYQIYKSRSKLSDYLALQAEFLEMNKSSVEANKAFDANDRAKIIKRQHAMAIRLKNLSDRLRISSAVSVKDKDSEIKKDNSRLTLDNIRSSVNATEFEFM